MHIPYHIIVESEEYENYAKVINPSKILVLPLKYKADYNPCCKLIDGQSCGSGPARNYAWEHSIEQGATSHWIIDDNITWFARNNNNKYIQCADGVFFRCMEDYCDRFLNVGMAGPNYHMFIVHGKKKAPYTLNTRIYSCILIRNNLLFRWRCRYNEDTDLSLRVLKAGYCTILFNAFEQHKVTTQVMKGGNMQEIYAHGTLFKSQMLVALHPDVTQLKFKFRRWHHQVNYLKFKDRHLIPRKDLDIKQSIDNYGMKLIKVSEPKQKKRILLKDIKSLV